ncbi:MAG TPA: toll/interleukin-1 receptor domain-containing protein [Verrucomicrobiae bacterium]
MPRTKQANWATRFATEAPDFRGAALDGEVFSNLELREQDFRRATLRRAEFIGCDLTASNFTDADLSGANFRGAKLENVDFTAANLSNANFHRAKLIGAVFLGANLFGTIFREAEMGQTAFANVDLDTCVGLETVHHRAPSFVGVECLYRSGTNLPLKFFEGAGFTKILIDYLPSLVEAGTPIQFHSCFISYSHTDEAFARKLWTGMRKERIRVWYAPEEMKGGRKLFEQIDRAIQMHDRLLIVLSKESIGSNWVQTEIRRARKQEKLQNERKLFPIRLCDMDTLKRWECFDSDTGRDLAEEIREYFIPDFSGWRREEQFENSFQKLCRDLRREGVTSTGVVGST